MPASSAPLVATWVSAAVAQDLGIVTGCATGADAQTISAALGQDFGASLHVFAAFGPGGSAAWSGSAVEAVKKAAQSYASVNWWSGGSWRVPLVARLMSRSMAAVRTASACVFFAPGPGSLKVAAYAIGRGLPVYAVQSSAPAAPRNCAGSWVATMYLGLPCWCWSPAQKG